MPNPNHFNMYDRPESYWDSPFAGFANIKGEMRRHMIFKPLKRVISQDFPGRSFQTNYHIPSAGNALNLQTILHRLRRKNAK